MTKILTFIKQNKLTTFLFLLVLFLLLKETPNRFFSLKRFGPSGFVQIAPKEIGQPAVDRAYPDYSPSILAPSREFAPAPEVAERLLVQESHLSLLVKNVSQTLSSIKNYTNSIGGYLVESSLANPQEAATGQIALRLPAEKLDEALSYFRSLAVKVVSENLKGEDVTDEYVDIAARLEILQKNKSRFEEIMSKAVEIEDILRIQKEIINLQTQIDNLKGRQKYLEQTAKMAKVTVFLSTDELALPYAPAQPWRPQVIFKQAVRSLIANFQKAGTVIIWLAVYSPVWLPALLIFILLGRKLRS